MALAFKMTSTRMKGIQHFKLKTHGGNQHFEPQVDPSSMVKMFL
jgi:hypothetical protein